MKTTVPGIITLGAIGSIVAFAALKIVSAIGKRLFKAAFDRFMFSNFRPFSFAALTCYRYAAEGRWADLVIYTTGLLASFSAYLVIFAMCLLATVIVTLRLGVTAPGLLVTLVICTGITFIVLLRNMISIAGVWAVRFQHDHAELKKVLSDKTVLFNITNEIFKKLKDPPQPPAMPSPAPTEPVVPPSEVPPPEGTGGS